MKIKSARFFRKKLISHKEDIQIDALSGSNYDPNFLGCRHQNSSAKGFFKVYHGDKDNIENFLSTILRVAEDGQAIYEFIQNAADCDSSLFYLFYNEDFFLAINNGKPFREEDIDSILNVSQSSKQDGTKIGRFGIGFKLVHRLVGENEGVRELTQEYKGPILFSWSRPQDFEALLNLNSSQNIEYKDNLESDLPWLFKILITNFPAEVEEEVKDLNYQQKVLFDKNELEDLLQVIRENKKYFQPYLDRNHLNRGSLFFLRLGTDKSKKLDAEKNTLKQGIEFSLHLLKKLGKVIIQNQPSIVKLPSERFQTLEFTLSHQSEEFQKIEPEYQDCDLHILFGYFRGFPSRTNVKSKNRSNFYKFFPMGDEVHDFQFIIHCNAFDINASRRELQNTKRNENIFDWFVRELKQTLDNDITNKFDRFLEIYLAILLSQPPNESKNLIFVHFYQPLLEYIRSNVPIKNSQQCYSSDRVVIKKTQLEIELQDFGIFHKNWFYWDDEKIVQEAKEKLGLAKWDLRHLFHCASVESINRGFENLNPKNKERFFQELNAISEFAKKIKDKAFQLKLFKFSNCYYSISELKEYKLNKLIKISKIESIESELSILSIELSEVNFSNYPNLEFFLEELNSNYELYIYDLIQNQTQKPEYNDRFTPIQKQTLFKGCQALQGVGETKLKELILFKYRNQSLQPLKNLLQPFNRIPGWLNSYQIDEKEYFAELDRYLISEKEIYHRIIVPNWESLIEKEEVLNDATTFYHDVKQYFDKSSQTQTRTFTDTDRAYIYIDRTLGFKQIENVFYNLKLEKTSAYQDLKVAIKELTYLYLPDNSILQYLSQKPFKTDSDILHEVLIKQNINYAELEVKNIVALIEFFKFSETSFFESLYISDRSTQTGYTVHQKSNNSSVYQYYTDKNALKKYLEAHHSNTFKLLPPEFNKYNQSPGILQNQQIYAELIEQDFDRDLVSVIRESGNDDIKLQFLEKISRLELRESYSYDENSYDFQILELACDCFLKKENYTSHDRFLEKIKIVDRENKTYDLRSIAVNDDVTFNLNNNEYALKLSEILPSYKTNSGVLASIMKQLNSIKPQLKTLFKIESPKDIEEVYEELQQELNQNQRCLENASQLAFVMLYAKEKKNTDILNNFLIEIEINE